MKTRNKYNSFIDPTADLLVWLYRVAKKEPLKGVLLGIIGVGIGSVIPLIGILIIIFSLVYILVCLFEYYIHLMR